MASNNHAKTILAWIGLLEEQYRAPTLTRIHGMRATAEGYREIGRFKRDHPNTDAAFAWLHDLAADADPPLRGKPLIEILDLDEV